MWIDVIGGEDELGPTGVVGADDSRAPWAGEEGLARCWDEVPWPPRVFAMSPK